MEKAIKIQAGEDTPKVILDRDNNVFEISGRSLPEDALKFYQPILKWIKAYITNANPNTEFKINLEYFNSSSVKQLLEILILLEQLVGNDKTINVIWYYGVDDELMETKGRELKSLLNLPFELISLESGSF